MNSDGSYSLNRERMFSVSTFKLSRFSSFIRAGAQASCAILPRNVNRPWGQCIGMTVHGSRAWALLNINRSIRSEAIVFGRLPAPKYRSAQLRRQRGAPHGVFRPFPVTTLSDDTISHFVHIHRRGFVCFPNDPPYTVTRRPCSFLPVP